MSNLSQYLKKNCYKPITRGPIFESIRNVDVEKALKSIENILRKRNVYLIPAIEAAHISDATCFVVFGYNNDNKGCAFVWERSNTTQLRSVCFTDDFDKSFVAFTDNTPFKWNVDLVLKGASIVRAVQLVADVMSGKIPMTTAALNKAVRDAQIWESQEEMEASLIYEASDDQIIRNLETQKSRLYRRIRDWNKAGKDTTQLEKEYEDIKRELFDARTSVRANVAMNPINDPSIQKMEQRFEEEERATPEERFSDMESYILNVILGLDTSALICGAPGVGKTYRIMQAIKKEGKVRGQDYDVIKGKCTPMVLFQMLHDYKENGQLLVIDDADDIITDMTSINLIKAATDSSDERIVSYGSGAKIFVPEEKAGLYDDWEMDGSGRLIYPKSFVYEGGVIIITNMRAGQIDTAIRSRAMICDLNFTTAEVLDLVRGLSPHICPETLTPESKERALEYLNKLAESGAPMEISIRSFTLVAKLYLSNAPENAIERRIREQMKLKFERGGKKY
jgi:hypothetical protein